MNSLSHTITIIILLELIVTIVYTLITPKQKRKAKLIDFKSVVKGWIERIFITYALLSGFPHALTLFGALKLGTRLKQADNVDTAAGRKQAEIFNNYYLVGNLISVGLCILYYNLLKGFV